MVTRVKICGIVRSEDLLTAVHEGADAVGFVMEPSSPRCIADQAHVDILTKLTGPYCTPVAVYGRARAPYPCRVMQAVNFEDDVRGEDRILAIRPKPGMTSEDICNLGKGYGAVVLDAYSESAFGGTGQQVDWGLAAEVVQGASFPIILAGGLTPSNVEQAIHKVAPYAVDVSSGVESTPGVKDPQLIRAFIRAAKGTI